MSDLCQWFNRQLPAAIPGSDEHALLQWLLDWQTHYYDQFDAPGLWRIH